MESDCEELSLKVVMFGRGWKKRVVVDAVLERCAPSQRLSQDVPGDGDGDW